MLQDGTLFLTDIAKDGGRAIRPRALLLLLVVVRLVIVGLQDPAPIVPYPCLEGAALQFLEGQLHYANHPSVENAQLHDVIQEHRKEHHLGYLVKVIVSGIRPCNQMGDVAEEMLPPYGTTQSSLEHRGSSHSS